MQRRQEAPFALMVVRMAMLKVNLNFSTWEHVNIVFQVKDQLRTEL